MDVTETGQDVGTTSYVAATRRLGGWRGVRTLRWRHGQDLTAGAGLDADGPLTSGELTNTMCTQSWECFGAANAMSDLDGQSVV